VMQYCFIRTENSSRLSDLSVNRNASSYYGGRHELNVCRGVLNPQWPEEQITVSETAMFRKCMKLCIANVAYLSHAGPCAHIRNIT
jgi:hypothetical protein